jgi:hypothetical protein
MSTAAKVQDRNASVKLATARALRAEASTLLSEYRALTAADREIKAEEKNVAVARRNIYLEQKAMRLAWSDLNYDAVERSAEKIQNFVRAIFVATATIDNLVAKRK